MTGDPLVVLRWINDEGVKYTAYRWEERYRISKVTADGTMYCAETDDCEPGVIPSDLDALLWWANTLGGNSSSSVRDNGTKCIRCGKPSDIRCKELHHAWICHRCYDVIQACQFLDHPDSVTGVGYWIMAGPTGWVWYDIHPGGHRAAKGLPAPRAPQTV